MALISLMSVLVISLVVWLVLVFLSVTSGIEKNWLKKLTSLHAPLRLSPTESYYQSYYYKIDQIASASDYTLKTIGEKAESAFSDPYSREVDSEIPPYFPKKEAVDPVKEAFSILKSLKLSFQDYELGGALLKITKGQGASLSQMSYLLSQPTQNPGFDVLISEKKELLDKEKVPVILPKNYQKSGVKLGDEGSLSYYSFSTFSSQEQKIPIVVTAFYDPGLVSLGNKCIIVPTEVTRSIHAATQTFSPDGTPTNGIFVWFEDLSEAENLKNQITHLLEKAGIGKYWKVDTYKDFEFSKDLLMQFQSDKTLFLLIASIILLVACSNVISLLVLLVNQKKKEIAILETMGATRKNIALIFGFCGFFIGTISLFLGTLLALFTLHNLDTLVFLLSAVQGHAAFNPAFFGNQLPNELSTQALRFVLIATPLISFFAGLIPAIQASRIRPAQALRGE